MATYTVQLSTYTGETVATYRHRTPGAAYRRLRAIINGKARGVDKAARQRADYFMIVDDRTGRGFPLNTFAAEYLSA
jgi:hypothetical protein